MIIDNFPKGIEIDPPDKEYGVVVTYKDVPGFINEAAQIYEEVAKQFSKNKILYGDDVQFKVVELGTFLGKSTTRMCELIRDYDLSGNISFDTIDLFWLPLHIIDSRDDWDEETGRGVPPAFKKYVNFLRDEYNISPIDISRHGVVSLELGDLVNYITCDTQYAARIYDDETLDFVWCDANHNYEYIKRELDTFFPKMKSGGILAGDDYNDEDVKKAVTEFVEENKEEIEYIHTTDISFLITKK